MRGERTHFLFRSDAGVIDVPTWRRHAALLLLGFVLLTAIWLVLRPYTHHDLKTTQFLAPLTIIAYVYLLLYTFAVILLAVSYTNLTAKRLRDRSLPTGLAGLVPLLALFAGAAHWLQPQVPDVVSIWYVISLDILFVGATAWTVGTLGWRR